MIPSSTLFPILKDATTSLSVVGAAFLGGMFLQKWGKYTANEDEIPTLIMTCNICLATFAFLRGRSMGAHFFPSNTFAGLAGRVLTELATGFTTSAATCLFGLYFFPGKNKNFS